MRVCMQTTIVSVIWLFKLINMHVSREYKNCSTLFSVIYVTNITHDLSFAFASYISVVMHLIIILYIICKT
jgi:ABC-type sugar transport system permease subunit